MGRWERWLTLTVVSMLTFTLSVWLSDEVLPWGQEARIGTGTGAGAVLAALALTWGNTWAGAPRSLEPPPQRAGEEWVVERPAEADEVVRALLRRSPSAVPYGNRAVGGTTVGLHGAGGFGKTTLAELVCGNPSVRKHFKGGIYPFTMGRDIRSSAAVAAKVNEVARLITGDTATFEDPRLAGRHLGRLLSRRPPTLLVIDDVWHAEQLRPFLYGGRHCARIATTRVPSSLPGDALRVRVDRMTSGQARQVLAWGLPAMDSAVTRRLLHACGDWPLLLRLTNRILAADLELGRPAETTASEVLSRLRADGPTAVDPPQRSSTAPGETPGPQPQAVRSTIEASVRLLPGDGAARFRELGVFAEDESVPVGLITRLWQETAGLEAREGRRLCHDMADLSLVVLRPEAGTLTLHDVVREYLRGELGPRNLARLSASLLDAVAGGLPSAEPLAPGEPGPGTAWWLEEDPYLGSHLIAHLLDAGRSEQAEATAGDLRWVEARLAQHGPSAPYADLSRIPTERAAARAGALARAAHLLAPTRPEHSLAPVLHSRIGREPCWQDQVAERRTELQQPHLVSRWPLPDLLGNSLKRTLTGHSGRVTSVAVAPDGDWLASAGWDQTVRLWNASTGEEIRTLDGHTNIVTGVAIAPDGTWLASASWDDTVRLWNTHTGELMHTLDGHTNFVTGVAVAPGGTWLATTGADHTVRLWNVRTGRLFRTLGGHTATVTGVAVAPDGTWLATSGADHTIRMWDAGSGRCRRTLTGHNGRVTGLAVAPDGSWLATAGEDQIVQIWDAVSGRYERTLTGHTDTVTALAASPSGTWLVTTGEDHTARVWDLRTGQETRTLNGHTDAVTGVAVAPDGSWLATTGADRTVRMWNAGAGRRSHTLTRHNRRATSVAVSPGADRLASTGEDDTVQIWDTGSGGHLHTLTGHTDRVTALAFAPDGQWLATGSNDSTVRIWNSVTGHHLRTLTGHSDRITALAVAPDGEWLATVCANRTVRLWDPETARHLRTLAGHTDRITGVATAPDGSWLATSSCDRTVRIWNSGTGRQSRLLTGPTERITGLTAAPDGSWLATAGEDHTVLLWDVHSGEPMRSLAGHSDRITGLAAAPSSTRLVTTGTDRTVRLWDTATGDCVAMMRVDDELRCCAWAPGQGAFAAGGKRGLYLFDIRNDATIAPPAGDGD
ncbi:WD40 domain-containing protein [Streptomyces winkii]|uniref:WD40 domain-containing protein n=1 Tax=Streptomyces winkii TaxID=3051178 RepID=UPI0028D66624|nr:NB-ARC domain-containing protein [Streptomyces sp. DSM 40971]